MKFLVDAQLPPALAQFLKDEGHDAEHVASAGLRHAKDNPIWDYAMRERAVIVSKNEDFAKRISRDQEGPQVVWVRIGNTTNQFLLSRFRIRLPTINQKLERGEKLIELI